MPTPDRKRRPSGAQENLAQNGNRNPNSPPTPTPNPNSLSPIIPVSPIPASPIPASPIPNLPHWTPGQSIPHPKLRGEWAELRFMQRATEHGLILTKPWGDTAPYDIAVDHHGHFHRVQVKCTIYHRGNSYKCHLDHNGIPYTPDEIDFFAACIIPADAFYILPLAATNHQPDILLTPHNPHSKYAQYYEAWHLLTR